MKKPALFVLPTDRLGGAERVLLTLAEQALKERIFSRIELFVLSRGDTGTLSEFKRKDGSALHFGKGMRELTSLTEFLAFIRGKHYAFTFSTHAHVNALLSLLRGLGWFRTERLVTRESTMIFERKFGLVTPLVHSCAKFYGGQDQIVFQTSTMQDSFQRHTGARFEKKGIVLPNPIDLEGIVQRAALPAPLNLREPGRIPLLTWCGRLVDGKNPLLALLVLRSLQREGRAPHLVVIGDGPLLLPLKEKAREWRLGASVTFCGHLPNPMPLIAQCDVGLVTSDKGEGFPNVILEMLACGVRSIATTPCAGDLQGIPGVHVAADFTELELSRLVIEASSMPAATATIQRHLERRSPAAFLRQITGSV